MTPQFTNLVFEGGGVKGVAYAGALRVFQRRGWLESVSRIGGTSAGAINALAMALGYGLDEQEEILKSTDFKAFMDDSLGVIRDIRRLAKQFGYHKGDFFSGWIGDLIAQKLGDRQATFADLKAADLPDLYVIGTNLSTGFAETFSHERHGDMPLAAAVRISMSIPLFFAAVRYGKFNDVYVDGGVQLNYPVKLFDREKYIAPTDRKKAARPTEYYASENAAFLVQRPHSSPYVYNRQTLGFRLDKKEEIGLFRYGEEPARRKIGRFTDYARALLTTVLNAQESLHLHGDDWQRTVYIDTLDVGATDFEISEEKKQALLASGERCAETYLAWFENPEENPVNRLA